MESKLISEKKNELFNRKEVKLEISSEVSPKTDDVLEMLAKKFHAEKDAIKIKGIYGKFGSQKFEILANVYDGFADKEKFEIKTKKQREAEKKLRVDEMKKIKEEKIKNAEVKNE